MDNPILEAYWDGYKTALGLIRRGLGMGLEVGKVLDCAERAMTETQRDVKEGVQNGR